MTRPRKMTTFSFKFMHCFASLHHQKSSWKGSLNHFLPFLLPPFLLIPPFYPLFPSPDPSPVTPLTTPCSPSNIDYRLSISISISKPSALDKRQSMPDPEGASQTQTAPARLARQAHPVVLTGIEPSLFRRRGGGRVRGTGGGESTFVHIPHPPTPHPSSMPSL